MDWGQTLSRRSIDNDIDQIIGEFMPGISADVSSNGQTRSGDGGSTVEMQLPTGQTVSFVPSDATFMTATHSRAART